MEVITVGDEGLVVYEFPSGKDDVRAVLQFFKGRQLAHVRRYYLDRDGERRPGKGISVAVEQLPQLLAAVKALVEAAEPNQAEMVV